MFLVYTKFKPELLLPAWSWRSCPSLGCAKCCSEPLRGAVLGAKVERGRRLERGPNEHRRGPGQVEGVGGTMTGIMGFPGNL